MMEVNRQSETGYRKSPIVRSALIAAVAVAVLATGHCAPRALLGRRAAASVAGRVRLGEAGGRDAADVPRPPRSERAFAMAAPGRPERVLIGYTSGADASEVIGHFRRTMPQRGWLERKAGRAVDVGYPGTMLWYSNAAGDCCIIAVAEATPGETPVTILRMPAAALESARR